MTMSKVIFLLVYITAYGSDDIQAPSPLLYQIAAVLARASMQQTTEKIEGTITITTEHHTFELKTSLRDEEEKKCVIL